MSSNLRAVLHVLRHSRLCLPCLAERTDLTEAAVREELGSIATLLVITFAPAHCEGCKVWKSVARAI